LSIVKFYGSNVAQLVDRRLRILASTPDVVWSGRTNTERNNTFFNRTQHTRWQGHIFTRICAQKEVQQHVSIELETLRSWVRCVTINCDHQSDVLHQEKSFFKSWKIFNIGAVDR